MARYGVATWTVFLGGVPAAAYSQFTHEELIDLTWEDSIRPALLRRYPAATVGDLRRARAYAYGGCLIQDLGYYPFGKRFFSDLTHYVRTGDFVVALLRNAVNVEEFAFTIGALSHYIGDSIGHSRATNPSTVVLFPDLRSEYGGAVTYEEAPVAHVRTEFGFDVAQVSHGRYASKAYRRRIGFRVARSLLYRAVRETYGISGPGILAPSAERSYRWAVTGLVPFFLQTEIAVLSERFPADIPGPAVDQYVREIAQSDYAVRRIRDDGRPGVFARIVGLIVQAVPKIGPFRILATKAPIPQTERMFVESVLAALAALRSSVARLGSEPPSAWAVANLDLDSGRATAPGDSILADEAHLKLLFEAGQKHVAARSGLRTYLREPFSDLTSIAEIRGDPDKCRRVETAIARLRVTSFQDSPTAPGGVRLERNPQ